MQYYSLPQAVEQLGEQYDRVYYAITGKADCSVRPKCIGKAKLLTQEQIDTLRAYFAAKKPKGAK
jgi:hypothetical protein